MNDEKWGYLFVRGGGFVEYVEDGMVENREWTEDDEDGVIIRQKSSEDNQFFDWSSVSGQNGKKRRKMRALQPFYFG